MDVIFVLLGHVVVDDAVDIVDVNAARGNVRRNEDGELAFLECAHCFFALLLCDIAVDAVGLQAETS